MNTEIWTAVIVTTIPIIGGGIGYLIKSLFDFRNENREDHNVVMEAVLDLKQDVKKVGKKLEKHIDWHDNEK